MKIEITAEDIKNGVPGNYCGCPVALAVRRAYGSKTAAVWGVIIPEATRHEHFAWTPAHVFKWILQFDLGKTVEPFSFEMPPYVSEAEYQAKQCRLGGRFKESNE